MTSSTHGINEYLHNKIARKLKSGRNQLKTQSWTGFVLATGP